MSSRSFTEAWISSADFSNRCQLQTAKRAAEDERLAEEIMKKIEAATVSSKLDFFRSMGLEFSNCCEINYTNNNDNNNNDYDLQTNYKRPCRSSSKMSERIVERSDDKPEGSLDWVSKSKQNNSRNSKICDMTGCQKTIPLLRECRVTIIGEKCKTCGRSFKCIRDLQLHVKKKHRVKKSKKKLVIKIGDEVISRVPIKRKHLKWRQKQKQRTIDSSDDATSVWNGESCCDQISDEEVAPFVDHDRNCVTDATPWPRLMDIEDIALQSSESDVTLQSSEGSSGVELANPRKEEDEEIQVLLKITRPRKSITEMEINHETPNRTERERLLTDAIRDFVTMDDDLVEIIEPARDLQVYRDDSEIIEDYSHRQTGNLDGVEHNCSFHIDNADDIDCCVQDMSALLPENGNEYFQDDAASIHSPHYRNENGDIIPDFIDYTHCNNNVCEFDSLFYNDPRINMWDKPTCDPSPVKFDVHEKTSEFPDSLVLIKEEVMLDDLL